MNPKISLIIPVLLMLLLAGCEKDIIKEEFKNDAVGNYNSFWSEFDRYYGAFDAKHVNWDSLKIVYGKNIHEGSSTTELYNALKGLMGSLHDGHAYLYASGIGSFYSQGSKSYFSDVSIHDVSSIEALQFLIRSKYLNAGYKYVISKEWAFFYGSIKSDSHKIGYICLPTFIDDAYPDQFVKDAALYFKDMDAIIIDIRFNTGVSTEAYLKAMNLFATERKLYMKAKYRTSSNHSDFGSFSDYFTEPTIDYLKGKPIVVLINGQTASSSDRFLLGLKSQPNVISIGDTTRGALSDQVNRIMPNGWQYRFSAQIIYTPEGKLLTNSKGIYLEGVGIPPDFCVEDKKQSLDSDIDEPLGFAIQKLGEIIK